jgi:hypothetical protein
VISKSRSSHASVNLNLRQHYLQRPTGRPHPHTRHQANFLQPCLDDGCSNTVRTYRTLRQPLTFSNSDPRRRNSKSTHLLAFIFSPLFLPHLGIHWKYTNQTHTRPQTCPGPRDLISYEQIISHDDVARTRDVLQPTSLVQAFVAPLL